MDAVGVGTENARFPGSCCHQPAAILVAVANVIELEGAGFFDSLVPLGDGEQAEKTKSRQIAAILNRGRMITSIYTFPDNLCGLVF